MKVRLKSVLTLLVIMVALSFVPETVPVSMQPVKVEAAKKKTKVKYKLKKGTLTIYGKGKMPSSMTFEENKKIKKVVIKSGVTSISTKAFYKCRNLKKVTIPSTVKKIGAYSFRGTDLRNLYVPKTVEEIGSGAFKACESIEKITIPGDFKVGKYKRQKSDILGIMLKNPTVNFNTDLNPKVLEYLYNHKVKLLENDKKYKAINGAIYTKDGKKLIAAVENTKRFVVADGCEEIELISPYDYFEYLELPETVKKFSSKGELWIEAPISENLVIKNQNINTEEIEKLLNILSGCQMEEFAKLFPERITNENGMVILDNSVLLSIKSDAKKIVIPEGVKKIIDDTFTRYINIWEAEEIVIPTTIEYIGNSAFHYSYAKFTINGVTNLKEIGSSAFYNCENLDVEMLLNNSPKLTTIRRNAFEYTNWKNLVFPESVKTIETWAFCACKKGTKTVTIKGELDGIDINAFKSDMSDGDSSDIKFVYKYESNPKTWRINKVTNYNEKKGKLTVNLKWAKIDGADGYEIKYKYVDKSKKKTKKVKVDGSKKSIKVKVKMQKGKTEKEVYQYMDIKIRTYKIVNGKKVYGVWS